MAVAVVVLVADQVTKAAALRLLEPGERVEVLGPFGWLLTFNTGGAFGILAGFPVFFVVASMAISVLVAVWGWTGTYPFAPLGLILGGGIGNLLDRLLRAPGSIRGSVVDFIDLTFWPTFNLADAAIVFGVALLILGGLRDRR